ncbi:hypothetical protein ACIBI0_38560 [Microbispora rosea]|uniref:hypothetical protein n=1 Tax=Microbispora rosea TaxID=58117 RepID=UPI0037A6DEC2
MTTPNLPDVLRAAVSFKPGSTAEEVWELARIHRPDTTLEAVEEALGDLVDAGDLSSTDFGAGAIYFPTAK